MQRKQTVYKMAENVDDARVSFRDMCLDDRILEAISRLKWKEPTLIQEKAIPLALEGKDILARARTGSGKTAAFAIPVIQQILRRKSASNVREVSCLILAPSRELCQQIHRNILELSILCSRDVSCADVSGHGDVVAQRPLLVEKPDIVIGTPSRILSHIDAGNLDLKQTLKVLVIDEADLVFSFGFEKDLKAILDHLPPIYQALLMSATLTPDVVSMKKLVLHNPVILKLKEPELPSCDRLTQYHIKCEEEDKFVLLYALLKLKLIQGKTLIFVSLIDRCYRLKLYLEQFGIKSCLLNPELPVKSRCHAVNQFNSGVYDIIIASDEKAVDDLAEQTSKQTSKKIKKDKEYGVARGIDFQFVSNVINFDFPSTVDAYIHRAGRTARGDNEGTALSFVSSKEMEYLHAVENYFVDPATGKKTANFRPYQFKMEELEGFRYRARDAFRAVTKIAVREARLKEIKVELLNSQKLKPYFEDNPRDLQLLRHDKALHIVKLHSHLKNVPDYIVPKTLKRLNGVPKTRRGKRKKKSQTQEGRAAKRFKKQQKDPLKSFQFEGLSALEKSKKDKKHIKKKSNK